MRAKTSVLHALKTEKSLNKKFRRTTIARKEVNHSQEEASNNAAIAQRMFKQGLSAIE